MESVTAVLEELGDLKLYRIPDPVSVAARSQKQIALLRHAGIPIDIVYRRALQYEPVRGGAQRFILTRNRPEAHLGVPLPGGAVDIFETRGDRRILVGRGELGDRSVGEKVEIETGESTDVQVEILSVSHSRTETVNRMIVTNARPYPVRFESAPVYGTQIDAPAADYRERDGERVWAITIPSNGRREMTYRFPTR
jgi:hypothetical protein